MPQVHAQPAGNQIRLALAVIHSLNPRKAPDPVVYVAGGPGAALVRAAPRLVYQFGLAALLNERNVVLLDQHGAGLPVPQINCQTFTSFMDFIQQTSAGDYAPASAAYQLANCRLC